ncbi:unnamed protein product [Dovyalis caffra]|uniref:Ribosomal protein S11 n=1 Tax=Dovyalis caffra TaxID=77055 RepID=A0AAV1RHK7_9ROSI|nr:unnamed protein product [Dovyalis caffra]
MVARPLVRQPLGIPRWSLPSGTIVNISGKRMNMVMNNKVSIVTSSTGHGSAIIAYTHGEKRVAWPVVGQSSGTL